MADPRPLLSLTIPTYNRSRYLAELLECVLPQLANESRVELIISDNASTDDTQIMLQSFIARGLALRYLRNETNLGPDVNFLRCLDTAQAKYVWVMGDDDLLAPNTIPQLLALLERGDYDLVYLSSLGFSGDERPVTAPDPLGRFAEVITDGDYFMKKVSSMITLISANIVNKDRLMESPHPPFSDLNDSNLLQLGWLFPVIHRRCRILYVWKRMLFHRAMNSGGWGICEVFGLRLNTIAQRYFAAEPSLAMHLVNGVLSLWLPDHIMQLREGTLRTMHAEDFTHKLGPVYRRRWRYWLFIYTVARAPLPLAIPIHRFNRLVLKATRMVQMLVHHARTGSAQYIRENEL